MVPDNSPLLKNGLFVRRPLSNLILRFLSLGFQSPKVPIPKKPKKILLCNIANLGDVVIATTVLPLLKNHFPNAELGFLTSSSSAIVLKGHPLINHHHTFDHAYLNQCKAALHVRIKNHFRDTYRLKQELQDYDIAIDLYPYFPNALPLLKSANIPVRIGYTTGGFAKTLTHPMQWDFANCYAGMAHLHLLTSLGLSITNASALPSYNYKTKEEDHIVLHVGSANPTKEWELQKWVQLIEQLKGHKIVLTGQGAREGELCKKIASLTKATDLSNQLTWKEFVVTIQQAQLLISVDSASLHIAAASKTPTIGLFNDANPLAMWAPPGSFAMRMKEASPYALGTYAINILSGLTKTTDTTAYSV